MAESFVERLVEAARGRTDAEDPGAAFFEYLAILADELAAKRSLGHALGNAEVTPARIAERRALFHESLGALLMRAQERNAVHSDVTVADIVALVRASADHDAATPVRNRL